MSARRIVLIRHARPRIEDNVPPPRWKLLPEGVQATARLAERLREFRFAGIASSPEPKAIGTAKAIAGPLGLTVEIDHGLAEQARRSVGVLSREDLETGIAGLFANPGQLVFGDETADACFDRFRQALDRQLAKGAGDVIAVTHGTILTVYVARIAGIDPMPFWRGLGLPTAIVLSGGDLRAIDP